MRVAIHQPNFMPWYPFFQKMAACDVFVILQDCQFEKNNYQNRFNMGDQWYTMSVNKGKSTDLIQDKVYVEHEKDWAAIKQKLKKFDLSGFDEYISSSLAQTNLGIIYGIRRRLNIKTPMVSFSTQLTGTERLIEILKNTKATEYLSGSGGSKDYLKPELFEKAKIKLTFQEDLIREPILQFMKDNKL